MASYKTFAILGLVILLGLSLWAGSHISIFEELRTAPRLYWGTQALVDLYIGFILFSTLYFKFEATKLRACAWMFATFIFGNIASLVYILLRGKKILEVLGRIGQ